LREERKKELEEHVNAVNALLQDVEGGIGGGEGSEEDDAWGGIEDEGNLAVKAVEALDYEEEYVDEDRYTTVTVEAVDVSRDGLQKVADEESDDGKEAEYAKPAEKGETGKKKWPKKERKKKFRYESKAERKVTRGKQKAGNKARADARRGNS
jgi:ribosomal RNA-processing protein 17